MCLDRMRGIIKHGLIFLALITALAPLLHLSADKEDMSAGWTIVFQTQIAFTVFGWAQFLIFYPSEGSALIR